ncbi:AAA family ATPase [Crateriforma spongiae]|uniref:AAA family ATPase n=1 Tax=Crateriforma spongiae TaxID=2724528 RepID=UPI0014462B15|nr:AAA family ATPase [Crateriforma spongiae]
MRGLPGCGKSHRAWRLAGDAGVVLETDQFFYTQVGDDPGHYDYDAELLQTARDWNFERFRLAIRQQASPIVVDRGNGLNAETQRYAVLAAESGYQINLAEPDSPWWQELRVLLKYKQYVDETLFDQWAEKLSEATRRTHRVPASTIRRWMRAWRAELTIEEILQFE